MISNMEILTNELFKKALDLNEKDRAALAGLLIESLEETPIEEIESVWKAEVSRRVKELDSGVVTAIPWENVKALLLKRVNG
jgi:putative addiction module component (TIGR02574 family)